MLTLFVLAVFGASSAFLFDREVCYGDLGCFKTETVRSFSRPIVLLPDEPSKIGTRFFLYTRENPTKAAEQELTRKDISSLSTSAFNRTRPTKIIIHGFLDDIHVPWVQLMISELLEHDNYNVIAVDWRQGAVFPFTQATANVRVVAAELAKLIEFLLKENPLMTASSIHMIGHSLGAHAASEVGTKIKGVGRISGLDPAEPYFEGAVEDVRLEKRDAEFVDVIHSDGSAFLGSFGMGYRSSIGHVDFYPNGGADQPGCDKTVTSKLLSTATSGITSGFSGARNTFACSHDKAIYYYIESINGKCPFTAYPCKNYDEFKQGNCISCPSDSCSAMGFHADQYQARGEFYLFTNQKGSSPYCNYHYKITVTAGIMPEKGYGKLSITMTDIDNKSFGPVEMSEKDVYLESKGKMERMVVAPKHLGNIAKVDIQYVKDDCLTCFIYTDFFRVQSVEITNGEQQKRITFCGKNQSVATGQKRQLNAESLDSC